MILVMTNLPFQGQGRHMLVLVEIEILMLVLVEIKILMLVVTLLKLLHSLISYLKPLATCLLSINDLFVRINSHLLQILPPC
jgi:hypothetical protein